jgi:uncharacterized protein YjdB
MFHDTSTRNYPHYRLEIDNPRMVLQDLSAVYVTDVKLNKNHLTLLLGQGEMLVATITPANASDKALKWNSDNPRVATVDTAGVVTTVGTGSANITVTALDGGFNDTCTVFVSTPVSKITLDVTSATIEAGDSQMLFATVEPFNVANANLVWSSSNAAVATVNQAGVVTAVRFGTATITATAADGSEVFATCEVDVPFYHVNSVSIASHLRLLVGETYQFVPEFLPDKASIKDVTWRCDSPFVATISPTGLLTVIGGGSANVTVTAVDGGFSATCYVLVSVPVSSVAIIPATLTMNVGDMEFPIANVLPFNATNVNLTWSSSNSAVVTVPVGGGIVRAIGAGTATITATATDGSEVFGTCAVTVVAPAPTSDTIDAALQAKLPVGTPVGVALADPIVFNPADAADVTLQSNMISAMTSFKAGDLQVNGQGVITVQDGIAKEIAKKLLGVEVVEVVTLPVFEAMLHNAGETAAIMFQVTGKQLIANGLISRPESVKLLNILSASSGEWYTYVGTAAGLNDKTFTILDMSGNIFTGDIDPAGDYQLLFLIKDGGAFDLDKQVDGTVWGSVAIVGVPATGMMFTPAVLP